MIAKKVLAEILERFPARFPIFGPFPCFPSQTADDRKQFFRWSEPNSSVEPLKFIKETERVLPHGINKAGGRETVPADGGDRTRFAVKEAVICWESALGSKATWKFSPVVRVADVVGVGAMSAAIEVDGVATVKRWAAEFKGSLPTCLMMSANNCDHLR
jgi:hypothetical protein